MRNLELKRYIINKYYITGTQDRARHGRHGTAVAFRPHRFPSQIDFNRCREEIASALNDYGNRWCKRESVECNAMKEWKLSIFNIVDKRIKFYSQNTNLLPPKPKSSFRHLKQGIQELHRKYVLVPADKAADNVVVVCRLHYRD